MKWAPFFVQLAGRRCLIVGGGEVALRKARLLLKMGATLDVIAPVVIPELAQLVERSGGSVQRRSCAAGDVAEDIRQCVPTLIIAATDDAVINKALAEAAKRAQIWVNVVDTPALCTMIFPSIVDRSPLVLALSSGGQAPVLLRQWRERLEMLLPPGLGRLAEFAGGLRERVKATLPSQAARRLFWEKLFEGPVAGQLLSGQEAEATRLFEEMLAAPEASPGEVYLVGAGPGDPDLLTLRALRLMQRADVILYDNLVSDAALELCRRDAERIYVGKKRDYKVFRQDEINQLMVARAHKGQRVLRLKGGDPFIFGRGGEEIAGLFEQRVAFQVVPGITAASGCAAYAGIPLTHREYAQSVRFVTGHLRHDEVHLDWPELTRPDQTLVFYMGRKNLPYLTEALLSRGRSPDTPIAVIENGTLPQQKVLVSDLAQINQMLEGETLTGPTVAIIGEVVRLRSQLYGVQT